jgi:hypothetical protein
MSWTPNKNREVKNGVAKVSAAELAEFRKTAGQNATLRDLLNADKGLERRAEPRIIPQVKPSVRNEVSSDMVKNLARTSGVKMAEEPAPATPEPKKASRVNEENTETSDFTFKKGGKVGSASKRADGIAQRGKTRGTMVMCGGGRT